MSKIPEKELIRLAFLWAEQDRNSLAECWPEGSEERIKHQDEHRQLKEYRLKRFGKTMLESMTQKAKSKDPLKFKKP